MKLLDKIKKYLNKKNITEFKMVEANTLMMNDHLNIIHRAARKCVGQPPLEDFDKVLANVTRVAARGHESTFEHSNIVMLITLSNTKSSMDDLLELTENFKFLNYKINKTETEIYVLIGGSIRGYKHIFRNIKNQSNTILGYIKNELYINTYSAYFKDFINDGVMDENRFVYERTVSLNTFSEDNGLNEISEVGAEIEAKIESFEKFDIISIDDIEALYDKVEQYGFNDDDLLDICTITIDFKHISRAISQQMTRHRVAISQESQRYVDYSNVKFVDPTQFKPDKYIKEKKYRIAFVLGTDLEVKEMNTEELANTMMGVYPQLRTQGLDKEDARGFSLFNLETNLIMTFTFRQLIHFLQLRVDRAAQAEIRNVAMDLEAYFMGKTVGIIGDIYQYLKPKYLIELESYENFDIDEVLGEEIIEEEIVEDASTDSEFSTRIPESRDN